MRIGHVISRRASSLSSMCGSATLYLALVWAPVIVLGLVSTSDQVAYLTAASRVAAFILLIPAVQSSYLVPRFVELFHSERLAEVNALSVRSTRQASALGGGVAVVVLLFPAQLLSLFGTGFVDAVQPLRVLAAGAALACALGQVAPLLLNVGLEHSAAVLGGVALSAGVAAMALVGPVWGAAGVSVVAVVVNVAFAFCGSLLLRSRRGIETTVHVFATGRLV
jgi:O-antigen/teichoic acid export membrane protein